jgi:predicted small lipoprotein YifL
MTNRLRMGIALVALSQGLAGCGDHGSPTAPSTASPPAVQQPSPQPDTAIQPSITAIAPHIGSTRGGAWFTITGADFQPDTRVRLGDTTLWSWTRDSTTILVSGTPAHEAGTVDVIVTHGGLNARLSGGYTYEQPEAFDFNGDWVAHAGPEYETDMRFTIRNNVLVSLSCGTSGALTFSPAPAVRNGELSFLGDDGVAISGTLVSPVNAVGTINVPACPAARWWGDKSGDISAALSAHIRR